MCNDSVDTVTFKWQLVCIGKKGYALPGAICRVDAMIDGTAVQQGVPPGAAKLQDMVTESRIQQPFQGLAGPGKQVLPAVTGIPGFQFGRNIYKLTT